MSKDVGVRKVHESGGSSAASRYDEAAWNAAYDEAMQWRDWQECDRLLAVRESEPWYADPQHGRWWFRLLRFLVRIAPEVSRG